MQLPPDLEQYARAQTQPPLWFSGHSLTWIKASSDDTQRRQSLVEHIVPAGSASPWHVHRTEDESFYVVAGRILVLVEGQQWTPIGAGGFAYGPKDVPHAFRVDGGSSAYARILLLTNGPDFADFIRDASDPVSGGGWPEPTPADVGRLKAAATRHGIEILGPPPPEPRF